ncbi:type IV toxin-antitoxin system AbiEi family antitoxin domain-containing protein [Arthrobacter sp. NIO-1057]|uniref:type IV toxin-antitoxin system AbiEi family antitoxin domain-containing protein n=1 Tax=Arthrobacter sp. NIO-1057 TaxID=993071 RepID=UPI0035212A61
MSGKGTSAPAGTSQALHSGTKGLSRSVLSRGVKAGRLDRIARGFYLPADAPPTDWEQLEAATRRPDTTICLISALSYHGLTDEVPSALDVAIPRGARTPRTEGQLAGSTSIRALLIWAAKKQ